VLRTSIAYNDRDTFYRTHLAARDADARLIDLRRIMAAQKCENRC
jgi:hypothetical protein